MKIELYENYSSEIASKAYEFGIENFYDQPVQLDQEKIKVAEKYFSIPKGILLAFEDNILVGRIYLHKRQISLEGKDIELGGIGGVCTHKNYRNKGIATQMLKRAMEILLEWKCDVAYLCTNIDLHGNLYKKVGFVPFKGTYTFYGKSGVLYEEDSGMLAPVGSVEVFNSIMKSVKSVHLGNGNW